MCVGWFETTRIALLESIHSAATLLMLRALGRFRSPAEKRHDEPFGPSLLVNRVGREGIEPPQPKAADLQSAELTTCSICPSVVCVVSEV